MGVIYKTSVKPSPLGSNTPSPTQAKAIRNVMQIEPDLNKACPLSERAGWGWGVDSLLPDYSLRGQIYLVKQPEFSGLEKTEGRASGEKRREPQRGGRRECRART